MASLGLGKRAKWCITIPPRVSKSLSLKVESNFSLNTSIGVSADTKYSSLAISLIKVPTSLSCSSSISPTISYKTSSIVTIPVTSPYSSRTIAI